MSERRPHDLRLSPGGTGAASRREFERREGSARDDAAFMAWLDFYEYGKSDLLYSGDLIARHDAWCAARTAEAK